MTPIAAPAMAPTPTGPPAAAPSPRMMPTPAMMPAPTPAPTMMPPDLIDLRGGDGLFERGRGKRERRSRAHRERQHRGAGKRRQRTSSQLTRHRSFLQVAHTHSNKHDQPERPMKRGRLAAHAALHATLSYDYQFWQGSHCNLTPEPFARRSINGRFFGTDRSRVGVHRRVLLGVERRAKMVGFSRRPRPSGSAGFRAR
jgi:hypothetical protein